MIEYKKLEPGSYYHIYNRGNNKDILFIEERNYAYFIFLFIKHLKPFIEIYGYSLMENHFHILIRVKELKNKSQLRKLNQNSIGNILSRKISNFFNAYAKSINKAYFRTGSLFQERFRRKLIEKQDDLKNIILYIHANPQKHGYVKSFEAYPYSSYRSLIANCGTTLQRKR